MNHNIIIIHGIGQQKANFAEDFQKRLRKEFPKGTVLNFFPVAWGVELERREREYDDRCRKLGFIRDLITPGHAIMSSFAADLIAYLNTKEVTRGNRDIRSLDIAGECMEKLTEIFNLLRLESDCNTIVAHSLGTVVALDWLKYYKKPEHKVDNLILMGSPKAFCDIGYHDYGVPPEKLPGKCVNMIDPDDIIARPLKLLNDKWAKFVDQDEKVSVGNILSFWNAFCHTGYWTDNGVVRQIVKIVRSCKHSPF